MSGEIKGIDNVDSIGLNVHLDKNDNKNKRPINNLARAGRGKGPTYNNSYRRRVNLSEGQKGK